MAYVVRSKNHLASAIRRKRWQSTLALLAAVMGIGLIGWHHILIGFVVLGAGILVFRRLLNDSRILASGLAGERHTQSVFEKLPDSYAVLSDIQVSAEGKTSQVDHIIVGPTGVFVVETKNAHGVIRGNVADQRLSQHKEAPRGKSHDKTLYNPVKQVGTHVYRVAAYLKQNRIQTWVQGIVYFADVDTTVELTGHGQISVFSHRDNGPTELLTYIESHSGKSLTKHETTKIVDCLKRCAVRRRKKVKS